MGPRPVIHADSKFFGNPPMFCVDVRFGTTAEIDTLIQALTKLRDMPAGSFDHVHSQEFGMGSSETQTVSAEITFWHPSVTRDETDSARVAKAAAFLSR